MKFTLATLRQMPQADLERLNADDLGVARELVRSEVKNHFDEMSRLLNVAGDRSMTRNQQEAYDAAKRQIDDLSPVQQILDRLVEDRAGIDRSKVAHLIGDRTSGPKFRAGQPLAAEQRVSDYVAARNLGKEGDEELSIGKFLRGMVTGDWHGAEAEQRALSEGTLGAGGYMLPAPMAARVIDRARSQARVLQAGARTVVMESSSLKVPRLLTDPTAAWHTENATITASDPTFDAVTLNAHTLAALTTMSMELLEDTNVDEVVTNAFAKAFALKLDYAALYGTGTAPEPRGVKNTSGILTTGTYGVLTADGIVDLVADLWAVNQDPTAIITSARTAKAVAKLKAPGTGEYIGDALPPGVREIPRLRTTQIPTNLGSGSDTDVFAGDWTKMVIGIRHSFSVQVLRERYADTGSVGLLAWFRGDIAIEQANAFNVLTGVTS